MSTGITTRQDGTIRIIEIDNPPVNAMSNAIRAGLLEAVTAAGRDPAVEAMILCGKGKVFCGGAEIREFGQPAGEPILPALIDVIEAQPKPVIAALHGVAFGGGFEIALGSHIRVGSKDIKLALPEVKLGVLPESNEGRVRPPAPRTPAPALQRLGLGFDEPESRCRLN